jgi:activator of 2-hydroxyglutaryl-CoA dehydratase
LDELIHKMKTIRTRSEIEHLPALFADENELRSVRGRHARDTVQKKPLETHHSNCYLGIDAGSTTTKLALIDDDGALFIFLLCRQSRQPIGFSNGGAERVIRIAAKRCGDSTDNRHGLRRTTPAIRVAC